MAGINEGSALSDEEIGAQLVEITEAVEGWQKELSDPDTYPIDPTSQLAADDRFLPAPYRIVTNFHIAMLAAVDHLHAMTNLIVRHQTLHVAAPWSLARGTLENAAIAFWIVNPSSRRTRAARVLRLAWQDNFDRWNAEQSFHQPPDRTAKRAQRPNDMTRTVRAVAADIGVELPSKKAGLDVRSTA